MSRRTWMIVGLVLLLWIAGTVAFIWWSGQLTVTGCPDPCAVP